MTLSEYVIDRLPTNVGGYTSASGQHHAEETVAKAEWDDVGAGAVVAYQRSLRRAPALDGWTLAVAQEVERGRIARDLHDDTIQRLIAVGQEIERIQRLMLRDPAHVPYRLRVMRTEITTLVHSVRAIIADLRPPALDELGFLPAVEMLLHCRNEDDPTVSLTVTGTVRQLDRHKELALFRILQEAWSNVRRHAKATHVAVHVLYATDALTATMVDDGCGFTPSSRRPIRETHWGLRGMQERAASMGGRVTIESQPQAGTSIAAWMPYADNIHQRNKMHQAVLALSPRDLPREETLGCSCSGKLDMKADTMTEGIA